MALRYKNYSRYLEKDSFDFGKTYRNSQTNEIIPFLRSSLTRNPLGNTINTVQDHNSSVSEETQKKATPDINIMKIIKSPRRIPKYSENEYEHEISEKPLEMRKEPNLNLEEENWELQKELEEKIASLNRKTAAKIKLEIKEITERKNENIKRLELSLKNMENKKDYSNLDVNTENTYHDAIKSTLPLEHEIEMRSAREREKININETIPKEELAPQIQIKNQMSNHDNRKRVRLDDVSKINFLDSAKIEEKLASINAFGVIHTLALLLHGFRNFKTECISKKYFCHNSQKLIPN